MSIYTGQIGQMLHVYAQHVKTRPRSYGGEKQQDEGRDAFNLSLTSQQRQKLEQIALDNLNRLTRKNGAEDASLSFRETMDLVGKRI